MSYSDNCEILCQRQMNILQQDVEQDIEQDCEIIEPWFHIHICHYARMRMHTDM
jgi:hypothetical protein